MKLRLSALAGRFAVARLPPDAPAPAWATGALVSLTRTARELSIVCADAAVPDGVRAERDFCAFIVAVDGADTLDFALTGILSTLTAPLAAAGVPVFALSTFDTDYLLVRANDRAAAVASWAAVATVAD